MSYVDLRLVAVSEYFPTEWEVEYEFRALEVNGRSRAAETLDAWCEVEKQDYKKILKAAKLVGAGRPVTNPNYVKPDEMNSGVYEMKAPKGSARLLYYYASPYYGSRKKGVVILLDFYWKTKSSKQEQERSFKAARLLMDLSEKHLEGLYQGEFGCAPTGTKGRPK